MKKQDNILNEYKMFCIHTPFKDFLKKKLLKAR